MYPFQIYVVMYIQIYNLLTNHESQTFRFIFEIPSAAQVERHTEFPLNFNVTIYPHSVPKVVFRDVTQFRGFLKIISALNQNNL